MPTLDHRARTDGLPTTTGREDHVRNRIGAIHGDLTRGAITNGFDVYGRNKHTVRKGRLSYLTERRAQGVVRGTVGSIA